MKHFEDSLAKLSLAEKLEMMETLWADITRSGKHVNSPEWHEEILNDRQNALQQEKATVSDWEQAKKRIRKKIACG